MSTLKERLNLATGRITQVKQSLATKLGLQTTPLPTFKEIEEGIFNPVLLPDILTLETNPSCTAAYIGNNHYGIIRGTGSSLLLHVYNTDTKISLSHNFRSVDGLVLIDEGRVALVPCISDTYGEDIFAIFTISSSSKSWLILYSVKDSVVTKLIPPVSMGIGWNNIGDPSEKLHTYIYHNHLIIFSNKQRMIYPINEDLTFGTPKVLQMVTDGYEISQICSCIYNDRVWITCSKNTGNSTWSGVVKNFSIPSIVLTLDNGVIGITPNGVSTSMIRPYGASEFLYSVVASTSGPVSFNWNCNLVYQMLNNTPIPVNQSVQGSRLAFFGSHSSNRGKESSGIIKVGNRSYNI